MQEFQTYQARMAPPSTTHARTRHLRHLFRWRVFCALGVLTVALLAATTIGGLTGIFGGSDAPFARHIAAPPAVAVSALPAASPPRARTALAKRRPRPTDALAPSLVRLPLSRDPLR